MKQNSNICWKTDYLTYFDYVDIFEIIIIFFFEMEIKYWSSQKNHLSSFENKSCHHAKIKAELI